MKLYDYYRSSACYRVRIALNLKNIAYETIPVHLVNQGGEQHTADYKKINPQSLVPTLEDQGHYLGQSLAIIGYLDETHPHPALLPTTALARAQVRQLALSIACDLHPMNNLRVLQQLRQQFQATDEQTQEWYLIWLKRGFDALEARLHTLPREKSVCYGAQVTLADLCLIPQVYNAKRFHFSLEPYPLINEINEYCLTLPAFIDASPE